MVIFWYNFNSYNLLENESGKAITDRQNQQVFDSENMYIEYEFKYLSNINHIPQF